MHQTLVQSTRSQANHLKRSQEYKYIYIYTSGLCTYVMYYVQNFAKCEITSEICTLCAASSNQHFTVARSFYNFRVWISRCSLFLSLSLHHRLREFNRGWRPAGGPAQSTTSWSPSSNITLLRHNACSIVQLEPVIWPIIFHSLLVTLLHRVLLFFCPSSVYAQYLRIAVLYNIPSGKLTWLWKITMFFMGKSTLHAMFNSYVIPEGI